MKADEGADKSVDAQSEQALDELPVDPGADAVDPNEALKEKYRSALAHKQSHEDVASQGHGEHSHPDHPHGAASQQRMFRRRAGG